MVHNTRQATPTRNMSTGNPMLSGVIIRLDTSCQHMCSKNAIKTNENEHYIALFVLELMEITTTKSVALRMSHTV